MRHRHLLLYRVRADRGAHGEFLVPHTEGTAFARACIEHGLVIVGIGEPLPGTTNHVVCVDFEAALAEFAQREFVLCDDCPPVGYVTDATRCTPCPRRGLTTYT